MVFQIFNKWQYVETRYMLDAQHLRLRLGLSLSLRLEVRHQQSLPLCVSVGQV